MINWKNKFVNKIIESDCLKVMEELPNKSIPLIVTDPPYGVRKKEGWDDISFFETKINLWLNECLRVAKTVIWFCADKYIPCILKSREDQFHRILIWNKPPGSQFAGAMHSNIWYSIEPILVFGEPIKNNKEKKYGYACFNHRTVPYKKHKHPTTKPIELIKDLIYHYSNKGNIILDPFIGSGTTAEACIQLERQFIGIEINSESCKVARNRIKSVQLQYFK